jgi:hypothetical protein
MVLVLAGCSQSNAPPLIPVTGRVTLDNQSLAGAEISFIPTGTTAGAGSRGRTDPEGTYKLFALRGGVGAVAGEYKVVISRRVLPDGSPLPANSEVPPIESNAREQLPPEYSDPARTKLHTVVKAGNEPIDFSLRSGK